MTDIRKDFEEWVKQTEKYTCERWLHGYKENTVNISWNAYQAGHAHDVDGLIAEIEREKAAILSRATMTDTNTVRSAIVTLDGCISIIRKHFGKE